MLKNSASINSTCKKVVMVQSVAQSVAQSVMAQPESVY